MERWSRARRKTERLIDFDGSSVVPQRPCLLLPAYFLSVFSSVLRLSVPHCGRGDFYEAQKTRASQICSPPVVVSDNFFHSSLFLLPFLSALWLKRRGDCLEASGNMRNQRIFVTRSISKSIKYAFKMDTLVPFSSIRKYVCPYARDVDI